MIKEIFCKKQEKQASLKAWVVSNRGNDKIRFLTVNDGSTLENLQVVIKNNAEELKNIRNGASIFVSGKIKLTPNSKQSLEMQCDFFEVIKNVDEDYPIQKQAISMEVLREIPHLRHKTNTVKAVMRVRSFLAGKIHEFFNNKNFLWVSSPILTGNDGEGAGEVFFVDAEDGNNFFGEKAKLSVTGQLHGESYANGFGNIYTFGPTFRAENSHTQRHASEFWMMEPEMEFTDIYGAIKNSDELIKFLLKEVLDNLEPEMSFLNEREKGLLIPRLKKVVDKKISIMEYSEAIEVLKGVSNRFENKDIKFGVDLATEHEKYLAEEYIGGPVYVVNYPKEIKAFYMYQNDDKKTVAAFDLLVPGIGELIGGSQRECDYQKIKSRINELGINESEMSWYLDLRRFGHVESSGYGLGFERLVMYVTGMKNIRDVIPFPRTPNNMKM